MTFLLKHTTCPLINIIMNIRRELLQQDRNKNNFDMCISMLETSYAFVDELIADHNEMNDEDDEFDNVYCVYMKLILDDPEIYGFE